MDESTQLPYAPAANSFPTFRKLMRFVRACLPEQPEQLALLFGSVLLLTVFRIGSFRYWSLALARGQELEAYWFFRALTVITLAFVYAGGAAALHFCFFRKANPAEWLRRFVFVPVVAGWLGNVGVWLWFKQKYPYAGLTQFPRGLAGDVQIDSFISSVGLGFWLSVAAVLCIWIASRSIRSGELSMPLQFSGARGADHDFGSRKVAWAMVACCVPVTLLASSIWVAIANPAYFRAETKNLFLSELYTEFLAAVPFIGLFILAAGKEWAGSMRRSVRFPPLGATVLGTAFPLILAAIPGLVWFAAARVHWAQSQYGQMEAPRLIDAYEQFKWPFLLVIISALAEEIVWRGYLQPRLISRYGLYRGIFFVGIVWGAFHLPGEFSVSTNAFGFATQFVGRLFNCAAWGFVLSWLTLRANGSVIPAGISHGLMNAFYLSKWMNSVPTFAMYALWAVLALVLYRFWPPSGGVGEFASAGPDASSDGFGDTSDVASGTS
jgi:membrane protease YdiL (CAAX protease family)